jgi:predicted O-methyltransferase YrrM
MGLIVPDAIEGYLATLNRVGDDVLDRIARDNESRGLPLVDAEVGALLRVLATAIGARRILEIGTAIGYSGIWLAGAAAGWDADRSSWTKHEPGKRARTLAARGLPIGPASSSETRS